ncbi:MAG: sugar phosphate nucleotidyltransferase [Candidatus Wallbacteria bacterium]|nr:sugar phosphate nucleotidyltransferase [Candidatus Wallbacteria bacterium]
MNLGKVIITADVTIRETLKKIDQSAEKVLIVVDEQKRLVGTITDGDIRRAILKGKNINSKINDIYNPHPFFLREQEYSKEQARSIMLAKRIELIPVVDNIDHLVNYVTWDQILSDQEPQAPHFEKIDLPVVIMAGGKGTRLEPFTRLFPKALVPISETTVLEAIINQFRKFGIEKYFITLNFKGEMIESYLKSVEKSYSVDYVWEKDFLGTAGSLKLLEKLIKGNFIVSNCDILIRADFEDAVKFHEKEQAALTIISSIRHYKIPYGVIKFKKGGKVINIVEKPEYTFPVNAGVYIVNSNVLKYIPEAQPFDMNQFISILLKNDERVFTYPVNENDYLDLGEWEEYKRATEKLNLLK